MLILSNNNCDDISYKVSINVCHVFEIKKYTNKLKNSKTKTFTNTKLVIEKSKQNNLIENNKIIWNCSKGVLNIDF